MAQKSLFIALLINLFLTADNNFDPHVKEHQQTYVEEQESLKNSLKAALHSGSEDEGEEEWGGLFKKREKNKTEKKKEQESYKEWLKGEKQSVGDKSVEREMKPLHDFWTDPNINQDDKFLRDYVINKQFLQKEEDSDINKLIEESSDENEDGENEDSKTLNHRFEETDQEFIKRYPRVMGNSLRRQNDHRKLKRDEIKERKTKEKAKKIAQVKLKKKEKKKEIEEKIEELKKITGNEQLAFENVLDQDFDLDEHDKTMKRLFNDEFYANEDPDFDPGQSANLEGTEAGDWNEEDYGAEVYDDCYDEAAQDYNEPSHCEDPNFNMDCDYDPSQVVSKKKDSRSGRRKDKHRRTAVSEIVNKEKPTFDPSTHESFQQYMDQYYAIDCEDFIGDLPCRFKYRRTTPNSYGLTVEEILSANVEELERWCSIKRIQQLRPEHKEKGDVKVYQRKAADENLKRKIIPSLFKKVEEEEIVKKKKNNDTTGNTTSTEKDLPELSYSKLSTITDEHRENVTNKVEKPKKKKKKDKNKSKSTEQPELTPPLIDNLKKSKKRKRDDTEIKHKGKKIKTVQGDKHAFKTNKKNKLRFKMDSSANKEAEEPMLPGMSDARLLAYGIKPKKFRNKLKYKKEVL